MRDQQSIVHHTTNTSTGPPPFAELVISDRSVQEKVNALKTDKLLPQALTIFLASNTIVPPLMSLYRYSCARKALFSNWKTARLTPIFFKNDDETVRGNHGLISLLSIPSGKIIESDINEILAIVGHIFKNNNLASDMHRQWTHRGDHSTEYLLIHLTETRRQGLGLGKFVAAALSTLKRL